MKIGIITIHNPPNYGAMLQAYSLCNYIKSIGLNVEIIDYRQPTLSKYFRFKWSFPPHIMNWLRIKRCAAFVDKQQTKSTTKYNAPEEFYPDANKYDALITGSDQVWFTGPVQYFDPLYFLELPDNCIARKISYAASAGGTVDFETFAPRVKKALAQYYSISVRDDNTDALVQPLIDQKTTRVVDPTFLVNFKELIDPILPQSEPYLLLFGNISAKWNPLIKKMAEHYKVKRIVSLQYKNISATHRLSAPSPKDWVNYFKHATAVVTTYFHGTAFAINFQKPFISIPTPGRIKKVEALLKDFNLMARFLNDKEDPVQRSISMLEQDIDWETTNTLLKERINVSENFLKETLVF